MTSQRFYRECLLRRSTGARLVGLIPERFAVIGKALRVKVFGMWHDDYRVTAISRATRRRCQLDVRDKIIACEADDD